MAKKVCSYYTGVSCVDGSCPLANDEALHHDFKFCKDCLYNRQCEDCYFCKEDGSCELKEEEEK